MSSDTDPFKLSPGQGFKLQPDGKWKAEDIPDSVLNTAKFSGYLTILNHRCIVFETPELDQWAQKVPGTSALASIAWKLVHARRKF